jgi:predicted transposase/invertase (TIGR01784 family)
VKDYWDYYSTMKTAHKKGKAEGREEGREEGRAEGLAEGEAKGRADEKTKTARKMKADGMTADIIAKYTGLTIEEIDAL